MRVDRHGAIADAMRAGESSASQADVIADACAADPHAEKQLLAQAEEASLPELRDECRRVKAAARRDELAHDDAIRRSRYLRTWTDGDGASRGEWMATPETQARILARLAPEIEAVAAEAKAAGAPRESREAYALDALARIADAAPGEGRSQVAIHLRVDHSALERGHTEPGEICEIEGVGPVPVATARNLSTDALIYVLATKGTDITRYASYGRYIPDKLRLALEARDQVCIALGCNATTSRFTTAIPSTTTAKPVPTTAAGCAAGTIIRAPTKVGRSAALPKPAGASILRRAAPRPTT